MSSHFGERLTVTVFGESHGPLVGAVAEGFPAGYAVDENVLKEMMTRRAPGRDLTSPRKEQDAVTFVSGVYNGVLTGSPVCVTVPNGDTKSGDYEKYRNMPRPSHADLTARQRYGESADLRGGGHFSGRLTAPLCALGAVAVGILKEKGIEVLGHLYSVGNERDIPADFSHPDRTAFLAARTRTVPALDQDASERMAQVIASARDNGDSVGGILEMFITGMPAGLGDPMFGGAENRFSSALFGIPGVKGVSFGEGFDSASMQGSVHNDPYKWDENGNILPRTNHAGGILGGITTGAPVVIRLAVKPTASIGLPQKTANLSAGQTETLCIAGRHDPCIALRALPAAEAVAALVALDMLLVGGNITDKKRGALGGSSVTAATAERVTPCPLEGGPCSGTASLSELRTRIDDVDERLVKDLRERLALVDKVGTLKRERGIAVKDGGREEEIIHRVRTLAGEAYADGTETLYRAMFDITRARENQQK